MEILISFLVLDTPLGEMGRDTHQFQIVGRGPTKEESINKEGVLINVEFEKNIFNKSASCCNDLEREYIMNILVVQQKFGGGPTQFSKINKRGTLIWH